jgi:hypothetical protein
MRNGDERARKRQEGEGNQSRNSENSDKGLSSPALSASGLCSLAPSRHSANRKEREEQEAELWLKNAIQSRSIGYQSVYYTVLYGTARAGFFARSLFQ